MAEIDAEKLIDSIKIRPALYNKNDSMYYSHNKFKQTLWKDVAQEVYPNWEELRPQNKVEYVRELQKRWKSLRTCFTRELKRQRREKIKSETSDRPVKRRKRYEYFNQMSFLLNGEPPENLDITLQSSDSEDSNDPLDNSFKTEEYIYNYGESSKQNQMKSLKIEPDVDNAQLFAYKRNDTVEDKILDMLRDLKKDEDDEDRQFMLSLVPSFRKLNDKQKLDARIRILNVLKDVSFLE